MALADETVSVIVYEEEEDPSNKSFFSEIISSVSDVKFSRDGRHLLSRDYLNLRIWDLNMDKRPLVTIPIHDHLKGKLCDLYENDCIFDKFECTFSGDGKYVDGFHCVIFLLGEKRGPFTIVGRGTRAAIACHPCQPRIIE